MARHRTGAAVTTVPHLPAEEIRAAIAAEDWACAAGLLAGHQQALADTLARADRSSLVRESWLELQLAQQALLGELQAARDHAAAALERLAHDHRGARAWLRELA
jgi:hypothetical protein